MFTFWYIFNSSFLKIKIIYYFIAAHFEQRFVVDLLISNGADMYARDVDENTPLHLGTLSIRLLFIYFEFLKILNI